jgi:hypothetical protein
MRAAAEPQAPPNTPAVTPAVTPAETHASAPAPASLSGEASELLPPPPSFRRPSPSLTPTNWWSAASAATWAPSTSCPCTSPPRPPSSPPIDAARSLRDERLRITRRCKASWIPGVAPGSKPLCSCTTSPPPAPRTPRAASPPPTAPEFAKTLSAPEVPAMSAAAACAASMLWEKVRLRCISSTEHR